MPSISKTLTAAGALLLAVSLPATLEAQAGEMSIEAAVARAVEDRVPLDTGSVFTADVGTLWLWTRVSGATDTRISHVWKYAGYEWVVELNVGGSPWRVWSSKVIVPEWTGDWSVEVRDENGTVLETVTFRVEGT